MLYVTPGSVTRSGNAENGHFIDSQKGKRNLIGYASLQKADWKIFISGTSDNVSRILIDTVVNAFWFTLAILVMGSSIIPLKIRVRVIVTGRLFLSRPVVCQR